MSGGGGLSRRGTRSGLGRMMRGLCPVCRIETGLLAHSGKVNKHGRTKDNPDGCEGSYQPPYRPGRPPGGIVAGYRADENEGDER